MDQEEIIEQRPAIARAEAVVYPDSDDEPMAEDQLQADAIRAAYSALEDHFHDAPDRPLLAGDLLLYYVEGDPKQSVAPDVMAVFGVSTDRRPSYKLWEEGKPPDFILEVSSPSSRQRDRTWKAKLYASLGVREYFLFDPGDPEDAKDGRDGDLLGYRLWGKDYVECGRSRSRGRELESETLGMLLRPLGKLVRFRDRQTGEELPLSQEHIAARREAEERWRAEAAARRKSDSALEDERRARIRSEARIAELESLLAELQARNPNREGS